MLAILDAETAVIEAESAVRLARIDAEIPAHATRRLDHDQDQLDLATAEQALARARATLADKEEQHAEAQPVTEMAIARAEAHTERLRDAITQTEIVADRAGLFIHGENPFTGTKIFAGETLPPTIKIAEVASRNALRFRFWVHEADILKVPAQTEIVVTADAIPALSIVATVDWTSKQATVAQRVGPGRLFRTPGGTCRRRTAQPDPRHGGHGRGESMRRPTRCRTSHRRAGAGRQRPRPARPSSCAQKIVRSRSPPAASVISTDVLKFGAPPSRNWSLPISQIAEEGKTVSEGDLLVQFDANMLDNRVRELAGNLAVSRGELASLAEQHAQETARREGRARSRREPGDEGESQG